MDRARLIPLPEAVSPAAADTIGCLRDVALHLALTPTFGLQSMPDRSLRIGLWYSLLSRPHRQALEWIIERWQMKPSA